MAQIVPYHNQFDAGVQRMRGVRMAQPVRARAPKLVGQRWMADVHAFGGLPKELT